MEVKKIVGIKKEIEADATGAIAKFHRIEYYAVDLRAKVSTLSVNGYVSAEAQKAGKQALTSINVTIQALPGDGDAALDFFYRAVTQPMAEPVVDPANPIPPMPGPVNLFAGAELATE